MSGHRNLLRNLAAGMPSIVGSRAVPGNAPLPRYYPSPSVGRTAVVSSSRPPFIIGMSGRRPTPIESLCARRERPADSITGDQNEPHVRGLIADADHD
jgi:hypothetical protein